MLRFLFALASLLCLATLVHSQGTVHRYTVLRVVDGDTLSAKHSNGTTMRIRLICVDAAELKQTPWGNYAQGRLAQLLPVNSAVTITNPKVDQYGRLLGEVVTAGGVNVNEQLVREGHAVHYFQQKGCARFKSIESAAKQRQLNVWSDPTFIMPWDFRKQQLANGK